jgi:hypothetical protein
MALTRYGFHDRPHDFAVTKVGAPLAECEFVLDFSRRITRMRQILGRQVWFGITVGLFVPVVHQGEQKGGYCIGVKRDAPYFTDLPKLWKKHYGSRRSIISDPAGGLKIIADFGKHFPEDC